MKRRILSLTECSECDLQELMICFPSLPNEPRARALGNIEVTALKAREFTTLILHCKLKQALSIANLNGFVNVLSNLTAVQDCK